MSVTSNQIKNARNLKRHFYLQLAFLTTIALTFSILLYGWNSAHKQSKFIAASIEQSATTLAQNIGANSVEHLITSDLSSLETLLLGSVRFPGVKRIIVTDIKGLPYSHVTQENDGEARVQFDVKQLNVPVIDKSVTELKTDHMEVLYPVISNTLIGWIYIESSLHPVAQLQADIWRDSTFAAILASIIASSILLFYLRHPMKALEQATTFADQLHLHRGKVLPVYEGTEEISRLGCALNRASQKLYIQEEQLSTSNMQLQSVLNNAIDAIITINAEGWINSFNPAAEQIFGYPANEVIGKNVCLLMPEPFRSNHDGYLKNYLEGRSSNIIGIRREMIGLRKDGSSFPLELGVSAMNVEGKIMFTGIVRDLTDAKKVDMMKNEFVSTVSHELRTPLTSIRGSLSVIASGELGPLPKEIQPLIDIGLNNSERLLHLINDILDIGKLESGELKFNFESLSIVSLLQQVIADNQIYAEQYNVKFLFEPQVDGETMIYGDRQRITQVIVNFLSNAAKFSHPGDAVKILVTNQDSNIRVTVADTGMGIPDDFRERVFQKFAQADSSDTRKKGGTGLGLYISMAIVKKHGGHIDYKSKAGKGSQFYFEMPQWIKNQNRIQSVM
ncbi:MAG: cell wall metabolism sensor histidine kinase WalK [Gammaproteobacteria bacterium]|nr:cell wall metabolism sensor histidine kinase WalK [Gammaproteobacteria bacterium]MDH5776712.1 cell wall metabolism sensor histidine kinase WalK [Gammaproteobacteria bacterium]